MKIPELKPCPKCHRPLIHNAAEMRKALAALVEYWDWNGYDAMRETRLKEESRAALTAPARNCDRFATVDEAAGAFLTEDNPGGEPRMYVYEAIKWMLAPANTDEARHD